MADLSNARVRLEGALEDIEAATDALEQAARQLEQGRTDGVALALRLRDEPRTSQGRAALERLVSEEPALDDVLRRFVSARQSFLTKLNERASELGLGGESAATTVEALVQDPVVYEARVVPWGGLLVLGVFGTVMLVLGASQRGAGLALIVIAALAAWMFFSSPRVVVTRRRICVGPQVVTWTDVRSLVVARVERRTMKGGRSVHFELTFDCGPAGERNFRLLAFPPGLRSALTQVGVAVRLDGF